MISVLRISRSTGPTALLSALTDGELAAADRRYPKWATMCHLRRIGMPVLNAVLLTPGQDHLALDAAVATLATATGQDKMMVRSDGGVESRRYYRGGNTFPLVDAASKAACLLAAGRAVILMEPTNRFTNRLTAVLRMDHDNRARSGTFTVEALGPGYDVADLTRGGILPQITVTADADWSVHREPWWSDLRMTSDTGPDAERNRRRRRLGRIAADVLTDTGQLTGTAVPEAQQTAEAETWLREHGYCQLWEDYDVAGAVARRIRGWFDDAFMIAACHPHQAWACLAAATSDLGDRSVFWDIVDGNRKYAARRLA
jgi:hypothetical protein